MDLVGKNVLVTGANRGLGRFFVDAFLAAGADKIYAGARQSGSWTDPRVTALKLDVTKPEQVEAAARICSDVDIVVNNAGVAGFTSLISSPSMDNARQEMEVNYFGVLAMCRAFAPVLKARNGGATVNILSVSSFIVPGHLGSYAASKSAELALTRGIRIELRAQRTLVVGVYAGYIATDMTKGIDAPKAEPKAIVDNVLAGLGNREEEIYADQRSREVCPTFVTVSDRWQDVQQQHWDGSRQKAMRAD
jgi:NAD(P)-dependent dehydrogenase (short-subunit alcohol dehydrogenase family)